MVKRISILFLFMVIFVTCGIANADESSFAKGNTFYEGGAYDSAIAQYEAVLATGVESAALHFNLGNAYFKKGDLGRAVLSYLRAKRLDPAAEDIASNLEFARQFSRVQMEGVELSPVDTFLDSLVGQYRLNTLAWWSTLFFVLFIGTLIIRFGLGYNLLTVKGATWVMLILCLTASALTTYKYRDEYVVKRGVIVVQEATVYSGPSPTASEEFQGSPGLVVEVVGESAGYVDVLFENKRRGWLKVDAVILM